jgi:general secretion pathway protein D
VTKNEVTTIGAGGITASTASGFNPSVAFLNADGVNAALSFLNTELDSKLLATPRAVTLDNQETRLEVTRAIPIFDSSEGLGQSGATVSSTKPNYTNVGTILVVTPRISGTNISLKLKPEISKVEGQPSRKVINGKVNEADIFATSRIDTQVVIPSGHTLVMGGLVSDSTAKNYSKVPILGDLPVLGWAFRKESKERLRSNLIIFLTPTIIEYEDFQASHTEFLNTKVPENSDEIAGPMTSAKSAAEIRKARKEASISPSGDKPPGASNKPSESGD